MVPSSSTVTSTLQNSLIYRSGVVLTDKTWSFKDY